MTLPKKKSRTIVVSGTTYRYVCGRSALVIEDQEYPGQIAQVLAWEEEVYYTPKMVEEIVLRLQKRGWNPKGPHNRKILATLSSL